jgi:hypothetical protein
MISRHSHASPFLIRALGAIALRAAALGAAALGAALPAWAAPGYTPITPTMSEKIVTLNGHTLTIKSSWLRAMGPRSN